MKSYLLAIGCDTYESETLSDLEGAVNDATNVFNCLVKSEYSIYDAGKSILLPSPTVAMVKESLESILLDMQTPDVFTLFFAGHGGVATSTYYFCLNDTKSDRLEFSGLSLSDIFRMVSSCGVKHVNLIIDACNTGGLVNDLTSIIKPDLIGAKGTFGIAILAAAASDEFAEEVLGQGLLTGSLIRYINGDKRLSTSVEYLDLGAVGRQISTEFIENASRQTPSSWGMNLYGPSIFSKNPFYNPNDAIGTYEFSYIPPASRLGRLIEGNKKEFWDALEGLNENGGSEKLLESFQRLLSTTDDSNDALALITGIGYRFLDQIHAGSDLSKLELLNVLLTSLVPDLGNQNTDNVVDKLINDFNQFGQVCFTELQSEMTKDDSFLLYKGGTGLDALSNYYYLSLRITKILGLISQWILIDPNNSLIGQNIVQLIYLKYSKHLMSMSDSQAPYLYVFFKVFLTINEGQQAKEFAFKYLLDYLKIKGRISRINLKPEKILIYLLQRYSNNTVEVEYTANPSGLGTVLLFASSELGLRSELDKQLHLLDRRNFHLFIPLRANEFSQAIMENGQNLVLKCGFDFWTVSEFTEFCMKQIEKYSENNYSGIDNRTLFCCIASAFSQPNRVPIMLK